MFKDSINSVEVEAEMRCINCLKQLKLEPLHRIGNTLAYLSTFPYYKLNDGLNKGEEAMHDGLFTKSLDFFGFSWNVKFGIIH